jgi:hypothetical protein
VSFILANSITLLNLKSWQQVYIIAVNAARMIRHIDKIKCILVAMILNLIR